MMRLLSILLALGLAAIGHAEAAEPAWPERPVKLITAYPPGPGPVDLIARLLCERLSQKLGQPFVVDPHPGASGNIALEYVAKAPADGYTLFVGTVSQFTINGMLFKSLKFDPVVDLRPLIFLGEEPFVLATNSPARGDLRELTEKARANPNSVSIGSAGVSSSSHIAGELYQKAAQVRLLHIAYKGGVPAMNDMLAGTVDLAYVTAPLAASTGAAGKLVPLAVTSDERSDLIPATPTMKELGFKGAEFTSWYGIAGPARIPKQTMEKIQAHLAQVLREPEVKKKLAELGIRNRNLVGDDFVTFVAAERARLGEIIKSAGITAE